jgi:hypothetical protein
MLIYGLLGTGLFGYGGWQLVGDFLVPRYVVEGKIEDLHWRISSSRLPPDLAIVRIGDQDYAAPTRTFNTLRIGDNVRAEVGRASTYIFRVETLDREGASAGRR